MGLLDKKIGMVSGGGSGIGRATCQKFAAEGARVLVVDIDEQAAQKTVELIEADQGQAMYFVADVSIEADIKAAIAAVQSRYGGLHIASNNAALAVGSNLLTDMPAADFERTYQVTLNSVFYCLKHQIPTMLESGSGAIVNIGSRAANSPNLMMSAYDSAKAAVNGLTRSAAKEYAAAGIRVNCVNPGVVHTEGVEKYMATNAKHKPRFLRGISMGRLGTPMEIAETVTWLCSDRASYITGQSLDVDGGMFS